KTPSLLGRDQLFERERQVRDGASLIDSLHALQRRDMQHLTPECEPCSAGAPIELFGREVGVDDGLDPRPWRRGVCQSAAYPLTQPARETAECRSQKPVLIPKVVRDEPGGNARAACDL